MAITLRYQPPAEQLANVALATGEGQYAQTQEQVALQQEALAQRERQFLAELAQRRDMAALGANQQNRQLGAQMYQFDATRQDRAAALEYQTAAQLQQEMMRQQGYADMREADVEKQASDQRFRLSQEQERIKQHYRDQQFNVGLAAAQQIEAKKNEMTPEMYAEAQGQWAQKYGNVVGDYPFNATKSELPPVNAASVKQSMRSMLGDAYVDGMEGFMGHEENGQWVWDLEPQQRAQIAIGLKRDQANLIAKEKELEITASKERQTKETAFRQARVQNDQDRIKYVVDGLKALERLPKKSASGGVVTTLDEGYKPTDEDRKRLMQEAEMMYPDPTPDLFGIE